MRTVTEYGIVGKIGVNGAGIGLLFNLLHHRGDGGPPGVPVHVLARAALDRAYDLGTAMRALTEATVSASTAMTLVGAGSAATVEVCPDGPGAVLPDDDGILVHTNHFLAERGRPGCREIVVGPDSYVRLDMLRRALRRRPVGELTAERMRAAMTSHAGGGGAVCRHADPMLPPAARHATLATVALDLDSAGLLVTAGGPCGNDAAG